MAQQNSANNRIAVTGTAEKIFFIVLDFCETTRIVANFKSKTTWQRTYCAGVKKTYFTRWRLYEMGFWPSMLSLRLSRSISVIRTRCSNSFCFICSLASVSNALWMESDHVSITVVGDRFTIAGRKIADANETMA